MFFNPLKFSDVHAVITYLEKFEIHTHANSYSLTNTHTLTHTYAGSKSMIIFKMRYFCRNERRTNLRVFH